MMRFGHFAGYGPGNGLGVLFFILVILFFAAVLWLILASSHRHDWPGRPSHPHPHQGHHLDHHGGPNSDAMAILDRRFASGEIDEDEYVRRRKLLGGES
jgi:putative membrane protein